MRHKPVTCQSIRYLGEKKMKKLMRFLKNEDGVTSVEYAVMVALIAAVVIAGATLLGTATDNKFTDVAGTIDAAS
jgi:pilus assembly protein Flp/PilA